MADTSYQTKTYRKQEGDEFVIADGGILNVEDGGFFNFNGGQLTAAQLKMLLYAGTQTQLVAQGATSAELSVKNLPDNIRYLIFSMTSTMVTGSFWLTSNPIVGKELYIIMRAGSCASGDIIISCSGCSLVGEMGTNISGFTLENSTNSTVKVHLACYNAGEWAVIGAKGGYAE